MAELLGIVNFENDSVRVEGMDDFRTIPAMSFLGRYRIIDFVLSNMVNSGIHQIDVLVKDKPRSLIEHIGRASQYNINAKHGSLQILYTDQAVVNKLYFTDVSLLRQYKDLFEEANCSHILIAPSYMICKADYREILKEHIESGADITCMYKNVSGENFIGCKEIEISDGRVNAVKPSDHEMDNISMETFIMSKKMFFRVIEDAAKASPLYNLNEYLQNACGIYNIRAHEYIGYLQCINSLQKYYDVNLELIDYSKAKQLFCKDWPIYTKTNDSAPAFYTRSASVSNSLIANGCVVHGTLDRCILGRGVIVEKGAVIKNSVLLPGCHIGPDAVIENAVIDKHAKVITVREIHGTHDDIAYIKRRDNI